MTRGHGGDGVTGIKDLALADRSGGGQVHVAGVCVWGQATGYSTGLGEPTAAQRAHLLSHATDWA